MRRFLDWAERRRLELARIAPKDVGRYIDGLRKENTSVATRKQHLAALRHFFDGQVTGEAQRRLKLTSGWARGDGLGLRSLYIQRLTLTNTT